MFVGFTLFILGLAFLLKNLGILTDITWSFVWPVILMIIGLFLIFRKRRWWE